MTPLLPGLALAAVSAAGYGAAMLADGTAPPWLRRADAVPAAIGRAILAVAGWSRRGLLAALGRLWPDEGKHSPHASMTPAPDGSSLPARAPAPEVDRAQEAPRPADPPPFGDRGAVRAGATTTPGAAIAAGGARQAPAPPAPEAAPWPGADAAPPPAPEMPPGAGQPVTWHRPDGTRVIIGWGPRAEIPRPYAQARVTGAHVIVPDARPFVPRRYSAFEAWQDKAVNAL